MTDVITVIKKTEKIGKFEKKYLSVLQDIAEENNEDFILPNYMPPIFVKIYPWMTVLKTDFMYKKILKRMKESKIYGPAVNIDDENDNDIDELAEAKELRKIAHQILCHLKIDCVNANDKDIYEAGKKYYDELKMLQMQYGLWFRVVIKKATLGVMNRSLSKEEHDETFEINYERLADYRKLSDDASKQTEFVNKVLNLFSLE